MTKVLRIVNRFNLGGPTFNAGYLTKYLEPEFHTKLIGGLKDDSEDTSEFILQDLNVDYQIIPEMRRSIKPLKDLKAYRQIEKIIVDFQPDIVHTHASKAGTLGRLAAIKQRVPLILHTFHGHVFHSYFGTLKSGIYKIIERYLASKSTKIIAISEKQKEELAHQHQICPADKIVVIPLGFDLERFGKNNAEKRERFRSYFNINDDEVAIGIVGRLVPIKNHNLFLEAVQHAINASTRKIRVFIVGDGTEKESIIEKAKSLGLSIDVCTAEHSFDKHCTDTDKMKSDNSSTIMLTSWIRNIDYVYAGVDIVALSSLNEGTPVSIIEAQAAGKPVVSTIVGGIENIVIPNQTALLCGNDPEALGSSLSKLIDDENLRFKMGEQGNSHVLDKFTYNRLVNDVKTLYNSLLYQD